MRDASTALLLEGLGMPEDAGERLLEQARQRAAAACGEAW